MPADDVIVRAGPVAVPLSYQVPTGTEIIPRAISASFDGSAAAGAYVPVLEVIAPSGVVTAYCARRTQIAAGASVLVSWFPGVAEADEDTQPASGLTAVASPQGTLIVANANGPTASLDLAASGVVAGSYGDSSHSAQVTVDAFGRLTAVSSQAIVPSPAAGNVVAYGTQTVAKATSATTFAGGQDLLTAALSFTADGVSDYQALVTGSFWIPSGAATSFMRCSLNLDGAEAGFLTEQSVANQAGFAFPFNGAAYIPAPSAAAHTVNARIYAGAAGITPITVQAGAGGAASTAITLVVVKL